MKYYTLHSNISNISLTGWTVPKHQADHPTCCASFMQCNSYTKRKVRCSSATTTLFHSYSRITFNIMLSKLNSGHKINSISFQLVIYYSFIIGFPIIVIIIICIIIIQWRSNFLWNHHVYVPDRLSLEAKTQLHSPPHERST